MAEQAGSQRGTDRGCGRLPCDPEGPEMTAFGSSHVSRRSALVAGAGALSALIIRPAGATTATMQAAIGEFTGGAAIKPGRVTMDIPPLVENGNSVPLVITVDNPMTEEDFVKE